jgi:serine/threonine protein kinase
MDEDVAYPLGPGDPREIGQFTVIGLLGAGGMGEVYLGTREGRYVAVKRVKPRLVSGERFNREVAILHRVPFGVAPSLLASDNTAPEPWFATEYVPGLTVDEVVRSFGPMSAGALWLLLTETAAHLRAVHEAGIVHRDLKPANIMLVRDGVKLIDFGIALADDQARLTRVGATSGTRGFTAPELEAGDRDVSAPADVYSLAATLVFAASVRPPGPLPDVELIRGVDPKLADVLEPCFAWDPEDRPSVADLLAAARGHSAEAAAEAETETAGLSWPSPVMERIEKRRIFAATPVSVIDTVLPPGEDADADTEPEPGPSTTFAGGAGDPEAARKRPRYLVPLAAVTALCVVAAGLVALLTSHQGSGSHTPIAGSGVVPVAGTQSSSASQSGQASVPGSKTPGTASGTASGTTPGTTSQPSGSGSNGVTGPNPDGTAPSGSTPSSSRNGGSGTPSRPSGTGTAPGTAPSSAAGNPGPSPTASSIDAINGGDDTARVPNSEADVNVIAGDAQCSGWLDSDGAGNLAGVLNTSWTQSCVAEILRSDGMTYTFSQSFHAAKTNFLPIKNLTMQICVWHADQKSNQVCSPQFGMSGTTPVQK